MPKRPCAMTDGKVRHGRPSIVDVKVETNHFPSRVPVLYQLGCSWNHGLGYIARDITKILALPDDFVEQNWRNKDFMCFFFHVVTGMSHTPLEGKQYAIKHYTNPLPKFGASDFAFAIMKFVDNEVVWFEKMLVEEKSKAAKEEAARRLEEAEVAAEEAEKAVTEAEERLASPSRPKKRRGKDNRAVADVEELEKDV